MYKNPAISLEAYQKGLLAAFSASPTGRLGFRLVPLRLVGEMLQVSQSAF